MAQHRYRHLHPCAIHSETSEGAPTVGELRTAAAGVLPRPGSPPQNPGAGSLKVRNPERPRSTGRQESPRKVTGNTAFPLAEFPRARLMKSPRRILRMPCAGFWPISFPASGIRFTGKHSGSSGFQQPDSGGADRRSEGPDRRSRRHVDEGDGQGDGRCVQKARRPRRRQGYFGQGEGAAVVKCACWNTCTAT